MKNMQFIIYLMLLVLSLPSAGATPTLRLSYAQADRVENNIAAIRVLEEAYQKIGYQIEIVEFPGQRALWNSNNGMVDGELHRIDDINANYPNLIQVQIPVVRVPQGVFSKKDFEINGWSSIRNHSVAVVRGYRFAERHTEDIPKRYITNNWESAFHMVHIDRLDVVIANKYRGLSLLSKLNLDDIHYLQALELTPLYHYLHKKHEHLVEKITAQLEIMEKQGRIEAILQEVEREFEKRRQQSRASLPLSN